MKDNQIIFYATSQGQVKIEVFFESENFWLTQKAMALLFGVAVPAISKHLKNIFETAELKIIQLFPKWKQLRWIASGRNYRVWKQLYFERLINDSNDS